MCIATSSRTLVASGRRAAATRRTARARRNWDRSLKRRATAINSLIDEGKFENAVPPLRAVIEAEPAHREARRLLSRARTKVMQRTIVRKNSLVTIAVVQYRSHREYDQKISQITLAANEPRRALKVLEQLFPGEKSGAVAELRDSLLSALRPEEEADEKEERVPLALPTPRIALRLVAPVSAAVACVWLLTAFPVYPAAWTAPLAIALGLAAWRWPYASGCALAAIAVPALWNQAEASALLFAPAAILWLRAGRKWGSRMYAPLAAVPLALLGIGPAIVLVAATAPTPRRRALEGAVGGLLAIIAGGTMPADATRSLAGANNPLAPVTALLGTPAVAVLVLACAVFAPLLHEALERTDGRRGQLLALWTIGFALCTVGLPQALAGHEVPLLPAAFAALVAGILAAGWAVVAPRFSFGR